MGADNIACRAIFEQFGPQKCMVGPHILQPGCFERQRKVAQSARWGYATTPKIPRRVFPRNGFEDIVCGIHPRKLLQIEILPIVILVSLARIVTQTVTQMCFRSRARTRPDFSCSVRAHRLLIQNFLSIPAQSTVFAADHRIIRSACTKNRS